MTTNSYTVHTDLDQVILLQKSLNEGFGLDFGDLRAVKQKR